MNPWIVVLVLAAFVVGIIGGFIVGFFMGATWMRWSQLRKEAKYDEAVLAELERRTDWEA